MLYEHWHTSKIRATFVSSVLLCATMCGANVVCAGDLISHTDFEDGFIEGETKSGWNRSLSPNVPDSWIDASTGGART